MTSGLHLTLLYGFAILLVVIPIYAGLKYPKLKALCFFAAGLFFIGFALLFIVIQLN
ncbi:hypothetical protein ACFW35_04815 [Fictibacillus sp. NPDC058756]|uniref:hypothetical protein n=1 Tax=Fictibacillus sp. NPDC058756 TaxID=3346625 RepID=UPI0036C0202A